MNAASSNVDRLLELLADQALFGLDPEEEKELVLLAAQHPKVRLDDMDHVAATVELSGLPAQLVELPDHLKQRVRAAMPAQNRSHPLPESVTRRRWTDSAVSWGGWVAAAVLLVALLGLPPKTPPQVAQPTPSESRDTLLAAAGELLQIEWTTTEDKAAVGASGDVVWNNAEQEGYMRFAGLAANDPTEYQYQLWIFDSEQDDKYPIDGGVFDIPANADEVIVPIAAKLDVSKPYMFAITVEKPGGVVVSSRERIPLLAKLDG